MIQRLVCPRTACSTITSGTNGSTRNQSVSRSMAPPKSPRKWPLAMPTRVPITIAINDARMPIISDGRAPQASSASTERPRSSVPSQ